MIKSQYKNLCSFCIQIILILKMFFSDYSEFLELEPEIIGFKTSAKEIKFPQSSNIQGAPMISAYHDLVYSQFTQIISKRLVSQPYPSNYNNFNPFCPLCLKFVEKESFYMTCFINNDRNYLIHQECLSKNKQYQFRSIGEIVQNSIIIEECKVDSKYKFQRGLDSRQFYIEITFSHPINERNFLKLNQKITLMRNLFTINISQSQSNSFFPNIIALPMTDYHLTINLSEIGKSGNFIKFTKYISFRYLKEKKRMVMRCQDVSFEVEIIESSEKKAQLIQQMNYKFKYDAVDALPMIRVYGFKISMPQQFEESDQDYIMGSSSTIVQQLLKEKDHQSISTIRTSEISPLKMAASSTLHECQSEKVNLLKLISSNTLIQFVKNNNQSRVFQNYLLQSKQQDIQLILSHIKEKIFELITHQYGNYMIQKLFTVCSPLQRLHILQEIQYKLPELARSKQGTHTIQTFISYFTSNQQFSLVSLEIMQDFYELCRNNNATHFIQKIIKEFPLQYTIGFFHYITQNLLAFALDKNAMCVIKHMMRRLRQLEGKQQNYDQAIQIVRRQIIFNVTFNVDKLIMDSFGNYVIQFCYELFDLQKCIGITQRILYKFYNYSMGKFSSNVLLKCISIYWVDKRVYQSLKSLNSSQILQIFRNKDGNKILLELMERLQGSEFWDRLYGVLIQVEPTKYYHDRWGVCLGSRSGQVGCKLSGFPEAKKKKYNRKY